MLVPVFYAGDSRRSGLQLRSGVKAPAGTTMA
jgi:hypothetical protein